MLVIVQLEGQLSRSNRQRTVRTVLVPMGLCELTASVERCFTTAYNDCISVCMPVMDAAEGAIVHRSIVLIVRVVDSFV